MLFLFFSLVYNLIYRYVNIISSCFQFSSLPFLYFFGPPKGLPALEIPLVYSGLPLIVEMRCSFLFMKFPSLSFLFRSSNPDVHFNLGKVNLIAVLAEIGIYCWEARGESIDLDGEGDPPAPRPTHLHMNPFLLGDIPIFLSKLGFKH